MKRILLALLTSLTVLIAGLVPGIAGVPIGTQRVILDVSAQAITSCAGVTDSDVQSWCNTVTFANTNGTELSILQTMVIGEKADGSWAKLDRQWVYALSTSAAAAIDLVARSSHTLVNAPTFTALKGFTGNGSTSYINTGFNPSTATNYQQNASFAGVYVQTGEPSATSFHAYMGTMAVGTNDGPNIGRNVSNVFYDINHSNTTAGTFVFASQVGFWGVERSSSTAKQLFYNSTTSVASAVDVSAGVGNRNVFVLAQNANATPSIFSSATVAAAAFGTSGTMALGISARVKTALTSLSGANFP